jgi:hypothetical protein
MPAATPQPLRQQIFDLHHSGLAPPQIASALQLPARTVRHLLANWQQMSPLDLSPLPHGGGRPLAEDRSSLHDSCLRLRRDHPGWGAGRIRLELLDLHPTAAVPPRAPCSAGCTMLA